MQAFGHSHDEPSEVAVLFYPNLSRQPFFFQIVNLDLLLCTEFYWKYPDLFLCLIFTQWLMVNRLSNATSTAFVSSFDIHWKFYFTCQKLCHNLKAIKTVLTLELSQCHKIGSNFAAAAPAEIPVCLPIRLAKAVLHSKPKSLAIDFFSQTLDCLLE